MRYKIPGTDREFEVPDEWWASAGMSNFVPRSQHYATRHSSNLEVVAVDEVEPPFRKNGEFWFRNQESVVAVLQKMRTGEQLEPIQVWSRQKSDSRTYRIRDGFHRFYLSIAVGYPKLPIVVDDFDLVDFLEKERRGTE